MIVYTGQMGKWRAIVATGIALLDTTVKTGTSVFMPTWQMVLDVKSGKITETEYTALYYAKMRECARNHPTAWIELIGRSEVCIGCFCPAHTFCHRYLLVDILEKYCKGHGIAFEYRGELPVVTAQTPLQSDD